jgi:branched-subunit amino acid ABC-type transport system permease component
LIGIDPKKMLRLILVLSGVMAGLVAVTRSMVAPVDTTSGLSITVFALIVTVVGGLGNVVGALLAGIILGIANIVAADLIGSYVSLIILLGAAAVTLLIRPAGLLGVKE